MISLSQLLNEGALEKAAEDYLRQSIKGTEWDGKVFIAGGYVRDELMGKDPKDLDIMVEAPNGGIEFANWITKKAGTYSEGANPVTFPRFGTAKFNLRGVVHNGIDLSNMDIEAVMPRQETYVPGSRKPEVQFSNLKGDAERRDLTVNAMYKNLSTGEYVDPTGKGMADLKAGILRTPLDPVKTFTDDPLRMLRLVRFFAKYGWKFSSGLVKSLKQNAGQLQTISKERIMEELNKMLMTVRPEKAMKLLKLTGLMDYIVPEFRETYKMTQNKYHKHTVWVHTLHVLKNTKPELLNRLMALFHDVGKITTKKVTPKGVQFIGHEKDGAEMAMRIMDNLKYPKEISKAVSIGVANHMKLKHGGDDAIQLSDKSLRKFQRELGNHLENILDVIHADNISHADESSMPNQIEIVRQRLAKMNAETPEKKGPPIDGNDIQREFEIRPGPIIGKIMATLVDKMDENPNLSEKEAYHIAKSIIGSWTGKLEEKTIIKTLAGTPIKRYKNLVGKQMGSQLYVHRNYAARVIPVNILQRATTALRKLYPDFKFNSIMLDAKTGTVRFDEAPDFDTAREPHVGKYVSIDKNNTAREGKSNNIWHHKWMWVMDDYDGFDVEESKKWSQTWLSKSPEVAKGTDASFGSQLKQVGLKERQNVQTDTPEFKRWFGRSAVVDNRGNPLVVFKGMYYYDDAGAPITHIQRPSDFPAFNNDEEGTKLAGFFSSDEKVARKFKYSDKSEVRKFFIRIERPYVIDMKGGLAGNAQFGNEGKPFRDAIRSGKYDGIIILNTKDEANIYVPLKSKQIKSVSNVGTFNPDERDFNREDKNVGLSEDLRSEDDGYYYHVTLAPYAAAIRRNGLKIKGIKPTISNYADYSKGKIFFTDAGALDWWVYKVAEHAFHQFDDERFHDVAVFRVKKDKLNDVQIDPEGSTDSKGESFYITHDVSPSTIEFVKIEKSPY